MRNVKRLLGFATRLAGFGLAAAVVLLLLLWAWHRQSVELPTPTGPYAVGRVEYDWIDAARTETLGDGSAGPRELRVWVWYPAAPQPGAASAPYLPAPWRRARESLQGPLVQFLGQFLVQDLAAVHSHAIPGAELAAGQLRYPVLIIQPGLGPLLADYTTLAEDLSSHGYVVVGSTPTYSAAVVVFGDGRVAPGTRTGNVPDLASPDEAKQILDRLIQVWTADDVFLLDQAALLNQADTDGRFTGRLDLSAVGVFGHSFGGAAAAEACRVDARFKAGADLDGDLYGDVAKVGLSQPFMFIWSEASNTADPSWEQAQRVARSVQGRLGERGYMLTIRGARHFNFTDNSVLYAPFLRLRGGLGPIDGRRMLAITADYLRAFFDQTLKGQDTPLLAGPSPAYPEVQFESR